MTLPSRSGSPTTRRSPAPSFAREIARARRDDPYPVASIMRHKIGNRRLLEHLGAPLPRRFRELGALDALRPEHLAEPTVVKPTGGSNNRGVLTLVPRGDGTWLELGHDEELRFDDVRASLARALVADSLDDDWVAEELLLTPDGRLLDDVKLLMFRGRLGAAFVRRNPDRTFNWFDGDWRPIDPGVPLHRIDRAIPPPSRLDELTDLAARLSSALPIPSVRVDVYVTDAGPVVGELTPYPGWAYDLETGLDARLGRLYEEAEAALLRDGMDWARVSSPELRAVAASLPRGLP